MEYPCSSSFFCYFQKPLPAEHKGHSPHGSVWIMLLYNLMLNALIQDLAVRLNPLCPAGYASTANALF